MPDAAELVKTIKRTAIEAVQAGNPADVCFGTVQSTEPLRISIEQKLVLGPAQLVLSRQVTEHKVRISRQWTTESALDSHSHSVKGSTEEDGEPPHLHGLTGSTGEASLAHTHRIAGSGEVVVHNGLSAGETVILLRQSGGQKYIVIDRVG